MIPRGNARRSLQFSLVVLALSTFHTATAQSNGTLSPTTNATVPSVQKPLDGDLKATPKRWRYSKIIAAGTIGLVHVSYATWSYFAWYRNADTEAFHVEREPVFKLETYAGAADKFGHFWSNYALTRLTTAVLVRGGWDRFPSSLVASGLTEIAFTLTEFQDGFVYGFDMTDLGANVAGSAVAVVMENVPSIDRLLDLRVQYFPSKDYRRSFRETGSVDIAQDYTGQSYILGIHLGAVPGLSGSDWNYWSRFVDFAIGFEAKYYAPIPEVRHDWPRQTLYLGLAVNMQGVLNHLFRESAARRVAAGVFEVYSAPFSTLRFVESSRQWEGAPL